jgi:hypothetical protein
MTSDDDDGWVTVETGDDGVGAALEMDPTRDEYIQFIRRKPSMDEYMDFIARCRGVDSVLYQVSASPPPPPHAHTHTRTHAHTHTCTHAHTRLLQAECCFPLHESH